MKTSWVLVGGALLGLDVVAAAMWLSPGAAPDPTAVRSFHATARRHIEEREYWASPSEDGLQAPNRRHDLRTWFEPTGVRVHERAALDSPQLVDLRLVGLGRGDAFESVAAGVVESHQGRVEIRRDGLVEWYQNSPEGLEQGFTLADRPGGPTHDPLVLELAVAGASASLRDREVVLASASGRSMSYGKLFVQDANGAEVPARFAIPSPDRIRLLVDDAGSAYPLVIDPLLSGTPDAGFESNQTGGLLGIQVAGAGDVNGDGYADVIVGAMRYDAGQLDEGAAFVFLGSASGMLDGDPTNAATQLESNQTEAFMGGVAGAGDVNGDGYDDVIVGAERYDAGQSDEGAAFVFLGSASGIADGGPVDAAAQLESNQASALMGVEVAGAGDVNGDGYADVIVSALGYDAGQTNEGAAFVFLGSASGIADGNPSNAAAQLESDQTNVILQFVASAGDVNGDGYDDVIVGSDAYDGEGGAFLFLGSASGIADGNPANAAAQFEPDQAGAALASVAGADVNDDGYSDVIVGASLYDAGETDEGAAFVFLGSASGIADGNPGNAAAQLESNQAGAGLGTDVAAAGDVNGDGYADVIVSAPDYSAGQSFEGVAFVFKGGASGIADGSPANALAQLELNQANARIDSVASAGDVDGDGYADVIVGSAFYDAGHTNEGKAFLYLGEPQGGGC
jgi:FG-GAP repeat